MNKLSGPDDKNIKWTALLFFLLSIILASCHPDKESDSGSEPVMFPGVRDMSAELPSGFEQSVVLSGLQSPSTMEFSPDGRLLIGERIEGKLRVLNPDGSLLAEPMVTLDIPKDENGVPTRHNSSGIRGFAFDPDFPEEPYIYIFYMKHEPRHNRVSRFRISETNPDRIVPGSEEVLIELPFNNIGSSGSHNGGALIFGEDDKLFITTGDGWQAHGVWGGGDPVQSLETMTGKVFRINKDGSIPVDNPFYDLTTGDYRAIYALGLRNPFSISRHPESQQIYINDANMSDGRTEKDHILKLVEAGNYKWERPEYNQQWKPTDPGIPQAPFALAGDRVIAGGAWYPPAGGPFPSEYHGSYFIALWGANDPRPGSIVRMISEKDTRVVPFIPSAGDGMRGMGKPVYTRIGPDGNLYWMATTYETEDGSVFKISYTAEKPMERLAIPRIEPNGGDFPYPVEIRLVAQSDNERIHYTLDGSDPDEASPQYNEPISISKPLEVKVRAFKNGMSPSHITSASFDIYEDNKSPEIETVYTIRQDQIRVIFDEAVDRQSAESIMNYEIVPEIEIRSAKLGNDFKTVTLSTANLSSDSDYTLIVSDLLDRVTPPNEITESLEVPVRFVADDRANGISTRQTVEPYLNMPETSNGNIPPLLSLTGVFKDVFTLTPASGVIPYTVNTSQWNDGAFMQRWIALPHGIQTGESKIEFAMEDSWSFPPGTVFIRNNEIVVNEETDERKRLETQLLIADSNEGYYSATYKWRNDGRDADLVTQSQSDTITIIGKNSEPHTQEWRIDNRTCMACHTSQAGYVLGVNTRQLNRDFLYPETGIEDNQLNTWNSISMFNNELNEQDIPSYPKMVALEDTEASLEYRMRSYFDVNCSNCHRPDGVMGPQLDLRFQTDLDQQGLIGGNVNNIFGIEGTRAIVPGDRERSGVYQRLTTDISGIRMPQFSYRIDEEAVNLLELWIGNLGEDNIDPKGQR